MTNPAEPRFWPKVLMRGGNECWEWIGAHSDTGYGNFTIDGRKRSPKTIGAHRFSYELAQGPVPDGLELDHLCRNRGCVNPAHLEPVTRAENSRRSPLVGRAPSVNKPGGNNGNGLKTHCKNGHPFDDTNTYRAPGSRRRECRICSNAASRRFQARRRLLDEVAK